MRSVVALQKALRQAGLNGWLFADFRGTDPVARRLLGVPAGMATRRWYCLIPARGAPRKLLHRIEPHVLDHLPGRALRYSSDVERRHGLRALLRGVRKVAMQYSPGNAVPTVAYADAGTVESVRICGARVVTSADLVQRCEAVWTRPQLASHRQAARHLREIVHLVFREVRHRVLGGRRMTEYDAQQVILREYRRRGLQADHPPIVAVNAHTADPHYQPARRSAPIRKGDLLLVDLWAKTTRPGPPHATARGQRAGSVYADITWMGYVGAKVPPGVARVFEAVRAGRDAALALIDRAARAGRTVRGCDADRAARESIRRAGYGRRFIHRTGHSLGEEVHGFGANLDGMETLDTRTLLPGTGFTIEPGIYLSGTFGVRSEINVYLDRGRAVVTGRPVQKEVMPLLV